MPKNTPQPWDKPPYPPTNGDPSPAPIHTAVGMALSQWESLENAMTILFCGITGMPFFIAIQIYGSLPSSASKQSMIRAAGNARFHNAKEYRGFFNTIMNVTGKFLERRNNIAHGFVTWRDSGHYLTPPYHIGKNFDYISREEKYAFNSSDIERFTNYFGYLHIEMMETSDLLCFPYTARRSQETPLTRVLQPSLETLQRLRILGSVPPPLESFHG
jgi:hypothetical protein